MHLHGKRDCGINSHNANGKREQAENQPKFQITMSYVVINNVTSLCINKGRA